MNDISPHAFPQRIVTSSLTVSRGAVDLKSLALFYDRIIILDTDIFDIDLRAAVGQDIDFLDREGVIDIRAIRARAGFTPDENLARLHDETYDYFAQALFSGVGARSKHLEIGQNGMVRLEAVELARSEPDVTFVPHIHGTDMWPKTLINDKDRRIPATEILFKKMPVPSEETAWQDIVDFRKENSVRLRASRLHSWMRGKFSDINFPHFERDVHVAMSDLESLMRVHQMKSRFVPIKILSCVGEILINLITGRPATSPLIALRQSEIDALELELKLNAEPLYFLQDARNRFQGRSIK